MPSASFRPEPWPYRLFQIRILVGIRRRAATEKAERLCGRDRVPRARRDEDRIARADRLAFAVEFYLARAFEDEIEFLRDPVIVPLRPASCGDARFCKALVLNGRIGAIENRTDSRAVFRDKRPLGREILDGHILIIRKGGTQERR
jgi:hypothetical protein